MRPGYRLPPLMFDPDELAGAEMRAGIKPAIQHRRAANAGAEAYA